MADQHGTATLALDDTAQQPVWRETTPYGAPRGTTPTTWPDRNGFLDKPADTSTGLVDVGARGYDPTTGRFISTDPILDTGDPQTMTGYTYADANPTTSSDPTGLMLSNGPDGVECHSQAECDNPGYQNVANQWHHADQNPLNRPVLGKDKYPNQWQLKSMRAYGYHGTDEFTWSDAIQWLAQPGRYQNQAWDMFCQGFAHQSTSTCAADPFNGDSNIYNGQGVTPPGGGIPLSHAAESLAFFASVLPLAPLIEGSGAAGGLLAAGADAGLASETDGGIETDAVSPRTPVGRRGQPLQVRVPEGQAALNDPTTIAGRTYSGHALDQMQSRGIIPSPVEDAVQNGDFMPGKYAGTSAYYDSANDITIIIDTESGRVITVVTGFVKQ